MTLIDNVRIEGDVLLDGRDVYKKDIGMRMDELHASGSVWFSKSRTLPEVHLENVATVCVSTVSETNHSSKNAWKLLCDRRHLGRSQGQVEKSAFELSRRTTAATLHCARAGDRTFRLIDGRTCISARSDLHSQDRGTHQGGTNSRASTPSSLSHNMQQAGRVSDKTAFFYLGELIEYDTTPTIFTNPGTNAPRIVTGRFG